MSFWDLSDGGTATETGKSYEVPGGSSEPIPDGSSVLAMIDEAKWAFNKDATAEYLSLRWTIVNPVEYANRKIFHKLWVSDLDPQAKDDAKAVAKRDKAKRMLAAIDANAGGKLMGKPGKPTDDALQLHLCDKPMIVTVKVWEMGEGRGNWVCAVAPKDAGIDVKPAAPSAPKAAPKGRAAAPLDDDIPF
jgi:hypothetical protein